MLGYSFRGVVPANERLGYDHRRLAHFSANGVCPPVSGQLGWECGRGRGSAPRTLRRRTTSAILQPRIDRVALQGQYAEDTLMHAAQWFLMHESLQSFQAQRKLPKSQ